MVVTAPICPCVMQKVRLGEGDMYRVGFEAIDSFVPSGPQLCVRLQAEVTGDVRVSTD